MDPDALFIADVLAAERQRQAEIAARLRNGETVQDSILEAEGIDL